MKAIQVWNAIVLHDIEKVNDMNYAKRHLKRTGFWNRRYQEHCFRIF